MLASSIALVLPALMLPTRQSACRMCAPPSEMLGRLNPVTLAYLGDAVWEQAARERLMWPPSKMNDLSSRVQALACAEGQYVIPTAPRHLACDLGVISACSPHEDVIFN